MRELTDLVAAAAGHDEQAWNELVGRYAGLIASTLRRYRLRPADAQDVTQLVWLHLVEHLSRLRDPAALPGWLVTTTRRECERQLRIAGRVVDVDPRTMWHAADTPPVDEPLLAYERRQALRDGLAELDPRLRRLMVLLTADPQPSYAEIGRELGIPVGSIGPTRARALAKLRATAPVRSYFDGGPARAA